MIILNRLVYVLILFLLTTSAQAIEVFNMSIGVGPLFSNPSQDYNQKPGIVVGALFDFSPGEIGWEIELLGAKRSYETLTGSKVGVIHGQVGAILRYYFNKSQCLSFGMGPYLAKPLSDQESIQSNQLEAGGSINFRWNLDFPAKIGPFGTGFFLELRATAGKVVSGEPKNSYFDGMALAGLRFGFI